MFTRVGYLHLLLFIYIDDNPRRGTAESLIPGVGHMHCPKNKADFREYMRESPLEGTFSSNLWKW
jgi:hypothetical protein